jgi:hypothetical protein
MTQQPQVRHVIIIEASRSHTSTPHSVEIILWTNDQPIADLYLTTHKIHNRQTYMPPAELEPAIPASERPLTHAVDRTATRTGIFASSGVCSEDMWSDIWIVLETRNGGMSFGTAFSRPNFKIRTSFWAAYLEKFNIVKNTCPFANKGIEPATLNICVWCDIKLETSTIWKLSPCITVVLDIYSSITGGNSVCKLLNFYDTVILFRIPSLT